jgi:glyoxylase I family protein
MTVTFDPNKIGVDLGIIIANWDATKAFYCDTLGFEHVMDMPFPLGSGGTMHRVQAGDCTLKLTEFNTTPDTKNPPGGATGAIGLRYFTFWVRNLEEIHQRCISGGYVISTPLTEVRPGVRIFLVDDPDGNAVEFLQADPV